jgi:competence protein ComEC
MLKVSAKLHTIRSKIISLSGKSYPYYFIISAILASFYNAFFILIVIFLLYKFRRQYQMKILVIFIMITCLSFLIKFLVNTIKPPEVIKGVVVEVYENRSNLILKSKNIKFLVKTKEKYKVGDVLIISGDIKKPEGTRVPFGFNYRNYLLSNNILYEISNCIIEKDGYHYFYYPKLLIKRYLDKFPPLTKTYLTSMILGINEHDTNFKIATNKLQISYLINLSGIFIYAIINLLKKVFFYLDIESKNQDKIILMILFLWSILSGFKFVVLRVLLMSLITSINRWWSLKLTRLDIIFYTFLSFLLLTPYVIYSLGFPLSFIILTTVALMNQEIKTGNYLVRRYLLYFSIYLSIFPILINTYNNIYIMIFVITPLIIITFQNGFVYLFITVLIMPFLSSISELYLTYFEIIINYLASFNLNISFPSFDKGFIFIYYLIIILLFTNKRFINKHIFSLTFLLFLVYNKAYLNPTYRLYFLDVNQGDTTIFITPFNQDVIVVDAYGDVLNVLRKMGIREIDYLILTHPDNDHIGEANNLINNINVKNVLINPFDDYNLSQCHLIKMSGNDTIISSQYQIEFYSPNKNYYNTNDNSLAFKLKYLNNDVLFLGDISKKVENEIVERYQDKLKSDILKLAHHGSNTSTSEILLNTVKPKDIIISVGINNIYGFPHQEVMDKLKGKYQIYRTDIHHTITYINLNHQLKTIKHYQNYIIYYIIIEKKKGRLYEQFNLFISRS